MAILAVNAGSSSLKFSLHPLQAGQAQPAILKGGIQGLEPGGLPEMVWTKGGETLHRRLGVVAHPFRQALSSLRVLLEQAGGGHDLEAVAHRVVHGGKVYRESIIVTDAVLVALEQLQPLAPLHQPHNVEGIKAFREAFPEVMQVACFDTAFHASLPELEYSFALPKALADQGIRRYGFHGLSYQYVMETLLRRTKLARGRVLMAHLGNGASLCAARKGRSCATTMGFSALDGLMMGTRAGALDAGVVLHLLAQGWDHDRLQALLYRESGLLGVSGSTADMRRLRADTGEAARLAIGMFTYRVVRESGALIACMGGLDVLAFSGGIGEHDVALREDVGAGLAWLGLRIDEQANRAARGDSVQPIHAEDSAVEVWVVPTDEGSVAAREAAALIG